MPEKEAHSQIRAQTVYLSFKDGIASAVHFATVRIPLSLSRLGKSFVLLRHSVVKVCLQSPVLF